MAQPLGPVHDGDQQAGERAPTRRRASIGARRKRQNGLIICRRYAPDNHQCEQALEHLLTHTSGDGSNA